MPQPYKIFTIYAREDALYLEELRGQLRPLEIGGRIKVWSDREINPGVDWEHEIVHNLDTADIILILVSAAYYSSAYIHEKEIKYALARHEKGEAKVLPIIVRSIDFSDDPIISRLQVLPTDGKPVNDRRHWQERDDAWLDVVAGIKRTLAMLLQTENRREEEAREATPAVERREQAATLAIAQEAERKRLAIQKQKEEKEQARQLEKAELERVKNEQLAAEKRVQEARQTDRREQEKTLAARQEAERKRLIAQQQAAAETAQRELTKKEQLAAEKQDQTTLLPTRKPEQKNASRLPPVGLQVKKSGLVMVSVKGGTFTMGGPANEKSRQENECLHPVTVKSFNIGQYEVTQADWRNIMGNEPAEFKGCDDCPVESVSWNDVQDFLKKLNAKYSGKSYRLPTEPEWEYAARGGNKGDGHRYAGSDDLSAVAWYGKNAGSKTHAVGGKLSNELGLYDMSGNVWEWCDDIYKPYVCGTEATTAGMYRVLRGGGWYSNAPYCRAAARDRNEPAHRYRFIGFRLVSVSSQ